MFFNPTAEANLRPYGAPPSGGRRESAQGLSFLTHLLRGVPFRRKEGESPFPIAKPFSRIVISSESEKSFSFAVRKSCEGSGEREAPYFMRLGSTVFHADGFTKENGNGKRKRSLGCARDDETGRYISHSFSIHSGSRLLLAFPLGEGGPRQRWIGCSR